MAKQPAPLSAMDDNGIPVDWWFLYKVAGKSIASDKSKPTGAEYVYYDSGKGDGQLLLSPHQVTDLNDGAVANTLNQIYNNLSDPNMGWFFYNDEDPLTGVTNGARGHTKGVLCFNLATDSGFWIVDSAPKFPPKGKYSYPSTATENAQTFLCITLKDADTAKAIAAQMVQAQQPNVFLASAVPAAITDASDPRALLIKNTIPAGQGSYANFITFLSRGGQSFRCIAKNKEWDKAGDDDFYNDLVGPVLAESIEVETWEHDPTPGSADSDKIHTVMAMKSVNLAPLDIKPSYWWSEENDHAKLAISTEDQTTKYVCVGDINFTIAQEKRSGGTVAFICPDLWSAIYEILSSANIKATRSTASAGVANGTIVKKEILPPRPKNTKKAPPKKSAPPKKKAPVKKKTAVKKAAPKKAVVKKKAAVKKAAVKKVAGKKTQVKKKPALKKAAPKKVVAKKKTAVKKTAVKKAAAKKASAKKKTAIRTNAKSPAPLSSRRGVGGEAKAAAKKKTATAKR